MTELERQIQVVAGQVVGNKRDQDLLRSRVEAVAKTAEANDNRVLDLRERFRRATAATELIMRELTRRVEKLEEDTLPAHRKRISEMRNEVVRLKAIDEERSRQDVTGAHAHDTSIKLIRELDRSQDKDRQTLALALKNHQSLIQVLVTLGSIGSVVVHWLMSK